MRLSEFFMGEKSISDAGKMPQGTSAQGNIVRNDSANRQLQSLTPGQTIQGEVVARNGNEVSIRLPDDTMLQARIDGNINLEVGKLMTFEVKSNGHSLMLGPLFTNMAMDVNVMKALDMASLPINQTTVTMTRQLMEAGMPIDKNALQQLYREANLFPQANVSDLINLHQLGMPVNEDNVAQMASYRNLTYQLVTGLNNVMDALPDVFSHLVQTRDTQGAVNLFGQLLQIVGGASEAMSGEVTEAGNSAGTNTGISSETVTENPNGANTEAAILDAEDKTLIQNVIKDTVSAFEEISESLTKGQKPSAELTGVASEKSMAGETVSEETIQGKAMPREIVARQMKALFENLPQGAEQKELLKSLLKPMLDMLERQWTIKPEEIADKERVEELYKRLDKQLKGLVHALENAGETESVAFKVTHQLAKNVDFLQQVNQAYTYVQLPIRLQQGKAHGDLYVYTNKKHLASNDGQISALLHLDMEHLGPVDVYVTMAGEKVNTAFQVCDDEMLDFLMGHMELLTDRLQKRGYQCSFEMKVRNQEESPEGGIASLLKQEKGVPLSEYSFDVRT